MAIGRAAENLNGSPVRGVPVTLPPSTEGAMHLAAQAVTTSSSECSGLGSLENTTNNDPNIDCILTRIIAKATQALPHTINTDLQRQAGAHRRPNQRRRRNPGCLRGQPAGSQSVLSLACGFPPPTSVTEQERREQDGDCIVRILSLLRVLLR